MIRRPHPIPHRNGFSLVEMMVVLFVMGLLATVAVMTMPGDERALRREAESFAAHVSAARDEAITGAVPVAMVVGDAGYYFERRVAGSWQPFAEGRFGLIGWAEGTQVSDVARTRLVFDPVGLASSDAAVRIVRGPRTLTVRIARDGQVTLDGG